MNSPQFKTKIVGGKLVTVPVYNSPNTNSNHYNWHTRGGFHDSSSKGNYFDKR